MVWTMKYIKVLHQEVQQPLQQPSLVKDRNEAPRVKHGHFHPSIHFLYPLVLFIVKRGFSQHALGERQASNVSQVNSSTVSQYLTTVNNTQRQHVVIKAFASLIWPYCASTHLHCERGIKVNRRVLNRKHTSYKTV